MRKVWIIVLMVAVLVGSIIFYANHEHAVQLEKAYDRVEAACGPVKLVIFKRTIDPGYADLAQDESYKWARECAVGK